MTLPPLLSGPAVASLGAFFSAKSAEDEARLVLLISKMQQREWAVLAGRVDQKA